MTAPDQNHDCPDFWLAQGCRLCQTEQYAPAIAAFDRAIELHPRSSQAWNYRGNALSAMQRCAEAFAAYDRAVALEAGYHQAWFNRGLLLAEMLAYGEALASYERAIKLHPDPRYVHARDAIWVKRRLVAPVQW